MPEPEVITQETTEGQEAATTETATTTEEKDEFVDDNADPDKYSIGDDAPLDNKPPTDPPAENEVPDEDEAAIGKVVDKRLDGVTKQLNAVTDRMYRQSVETDLSKIMGQHPEYKPYEARIRRFVTHDNRFKLIKQGLPVNTVVIEAIAPYLQKIGAAKVKAADEKANKTKVNGQQQQATTPDKQDYSKMTNQQITEMSESVKSGRYKAQ